MLLCALGARRFSSVLAILIQIKIKVNYYPKYFVKYLLSIFVYFT